MNRMTYRLELQDTAAGIGFFAPRPVERMDLPEAARYLVAHPMDTFIRSFLLEGMGSLEPDALADVIRGNLHAPAPFVAMLLEGCLTNARYEHLVPLFDGQNRGQLAAASPLIAIRAASRGDLALHNAWMRHFQANLESLTPLPTPAEAGLEPPVPSEVLAGLRARRPVTLAEVIPAADAEAKASPPRPPAGESFRRATEALSAIDAFAEPEMRHQASLSPVGLLRRWHLRMDVKAGGVDYALSGIQTSWGKGLSLDTARASYSMEIAERVSSFINVDESGVSGLAHPAPLIHGSMDDLRERGLNPLDLGAVRLDVPYEGQKLSWMEGVTADDRPVWIPPQFVYLFCNLDEPGFFSGLGSTGLASGNVMAEARLSGLLECLERDAEGSKPFDPSACFLLQADEPELARLLAELAAKDVHPVFQDVTTEFGVPCYKAFVTHADGEVAKGTGAHLDGRRAILSALLEVTYPYPDSPPSRPAPAGLPVRRFEELPSLSSGNAGVDLARLEATLMANGHTPCYVDLTRADLGIPVCRAVVPGLELTADIDRFTRVSPRLFLNYLKMFEK